MNLILISAALSFVLSLAVGTMLSMHESLLLQLILVVISLLSIKLILGVRKIILFALATASMGLWYSAYWVDNQLNHRLPLSLNGQTFELSGCILESPRIELQIRGGNTQHIARFELVLASNDVSPGGLRRLRLSWYHPPNPDDVKAGACIKGVVKLRTPRNFENGLAYDYQASMLYRGIDAIGYIRTAEITHHNSVGWIESQRIQALNGHTLTTEPWVKGLVFGDKTAFTAEQWELVQQTGTLHLLVVSGLHVGLLALSGMMLGTLVSRMLRASLLSIVSIPSSAIAVLKWLPVACAITSATVYVVVAGAGLSLIRAWVMLLFVLFVWYYPKRFVSSVTILGAVCIVLLVNPMSWTQSGFWFSFVAVAALVFFFRGRKSSKLTALLLPQLVIVIALLPASMAMDQVVSPIHIIANTIAIPFITFCILPLTFLSLGASADLSVSLMAMEGLAWASMYYWQVLEHLRDLPLQGLPIFSPIVLLAWTVLVCLIFAGARTSIMLIATPVIYCIAVFSPTPLKPGVWLVDSGQGQSLIISDDEHTVVIDTGPALSAEFSIASMVLTPLLRNIGVRNIDYLVLSHSDNDHAGGAADLLERFDVSVILVGQPIKGLTKKGLAKKSLAQKGDGLRVNEVPYALSSCHMAGIADSSNQSHPNKIMVSNNIQLEFFSIPLSIQTDDNNSSCVVRLHWYGHTLMVPGDASIDVERYLVSHYGEALKSDVLIAGHHGSKTSTSRFWLNAVHPQEVWVSAGFGNRFGHPHAEVVERVTDFGAILRNTAQMGKIEMRSEGIVHFSRQGWQPKWRSE